MKRKRVFFIIWTVLSALCLVYGIMVAMLHSGTMFFAVWLILALFFAGLAAASKLRLWERFNRPVKVVIIAAAAICIAAFCAVEGVILTGFGQRGIPDLDYIIVLGAQVTENGPSSVLKYRLDAASEYLQENPETVCIVSGGQGSNEPTTEAEAMAEYLEEKGVESSRIILENQAENTVQNIANSVVEAGITDEKVGIVTNDFHIYRAVAIAEKQGITGAEGIAAGSDPLYLPNNMLREFLGVVKDKAEGNI